MVGNGDYERMVSLFKSKAGIVLGIAHAFVADGIPGSGDTNTP